MNAPTATRSGVGHVKTRLSSGFTVLDNGLLQHSGMSLTAIALSCHLQSLPEGAGVSIRTLAARFPEGEVRIAAALRELERHGYLERLRVRLPNGRVITRTMAYTIPKRLPLPEPPTDADPDPSPEPDPPSGGGGGGTPVPLPPPPSSTPPPSPVREAVPPPSQRQPRPTRIPTRIPAPAPAPPPEGPAADLLRGLRADEPRLTLSSRDIERLAPGVDSWFARGATPDAVRRTLTACLPDDLKHPAGILDYRLSSLIPPPLPTAPVGPPPPDPFQTCDDCDRAFRAPEPGLCRECREARAAA
ncbi:helix-turn-helix domain-containing protein [Streptomyces sp. NPDC048659]|uniref:helix-turn-helix domain-containing protein n=1 Tax=Streptomyces sp. NPDC048659 TaxID=3155489 RepID=UPI003444AC98